MGEVMTIQLIDINEEVRKFVRGEISEAELDRILDNALAALELAIAAREYDAG